MNRVVSDLPRRRLAQMVAIAGLLLLGVWIAHGFLPALAWGAVIAVAIDPVHMRLRARWPGRGSETMIAAAITTIAALAVLLPLAAGVTQAAREAHDLALWAATAQRTGVPVPGWVAHLPVGREPLARWWSANLTTPAGAADLLRQFGSTAWLAHTQLIGRDLLRRVVIFAFTLVVLFFLLRDRDTVLAQCRRVGDALFGPSSERIGVQAVRSIRGTIDGLVLVGLGEGAVMAAVYAAFGVPHPILLGAVTAVAAMVPFGAALVFAVASLLLLGRDAVGASIAVMTIGLAVVGVADHLIRPVLIGGATRLPFLWVLIGILGGVETMGLLGLFVGPATMAVLVMLWRDLAVAGEMTGAP